MTSAGSHAVQSLYLCDRLSVLQTQFFRRMYPLQMNSQARESFPACGRLDDSIVQIHLAEDGTIPEDYHGASAVAG